MFGIKFTAIFGREANPVEGKVTFDVVIKYVDSDADETTRSFASPAQREAYIEKLIANPKKSKQIASVVYDDTLGFWNRVGKDDPLPTTIPNLAGEGEVVIRISGRKNSVLEATGLSLSNLAKLTKDSETFGIAQQMSVIRRFVAYDRRSVLVKHDNIPESALRFESANYDIDNE